MLLDGRRNAAGEVANLDTHLAECRPKAEADVASLGLVDMSWLTTASSVGEEGQELAAELVRE